MPNSCHCILYLQLKDNDISVFQTPSQDDSPSGLTLIGRYLHIGVTVITKNQRAIQLNNSLIDRYIIVNETSKLRQFCYKYFYHNVEMAQLSFHFINVTRDENFLTEISYYGEGNETTNERLCITHDKNCIIPLPNVPLVEKKSFPCQPQFESIHNVFIHHELETQHIINETSLQLAFRFSQFLKEFNQTFAVREFREATFQSNALDETDEQEKIDELFENFPIYNDLPSPLPEDLIATDDFPVIDQQTLNKHLRTH